MLVQTANKFAAVCLGASLHQAYNLNLESLPLQSPFMPKATPFVMLGVQAPMQ